MSRRSSNTYRATHCNHCERLNMPRNVVESHNVLNAKGFVCCPAILSNRCSKCGTVGHLPSRCVRNTSLEKFTVTKEKKVKEPVAETVKSSRFAALSNDDSSDDEPRTPVRTVKKMPSSPPPLERPSRKAPAPIDVDAEKCSDVREPSPPSHYKKFDWSGSVKERPTRWADYESDDEW